MASGESAEGLQLRFRTLHEGDEELLHGFDCGDDDLKGFLVEDALRLQEQNVVRTYLRPCWSIMHCMLAVIHPEPATPGTETVGTTEVVSG